MHEAHQEHMILSLYGTHMLLGVKNLNLEIPTMHATQVLVGGRNASLADYDYDHLG